MKKVLTPSQMREADSAAFVAVGPSFELMRRAGAAVGWAALRLLGGGYGRRVTVVCGKGNNAGDGMIAAAWLARRGAQCTIALEDPRVFTGDALTAFEQLPHLRVVGFSSLARELDRSDLAIDAIVGTGFRGTLEGETAAAVELLNHARGPIVSIDVPSGVNAETGAVETAAVRAAVTVTLAALKPGLLLHPGASFAGDIEVADIGIADELMPTDLYVAEASDVRAMLLARPAVSNKRSVGKVLVVAGSPGMSGAAVLAARGALRAGAGFVKLAVPNGLAAHVDRNVPEVLIAGLAETGTGAIESSAAGQVAELAAGFDSVALGPGLGRDDETAEFVRKVLLVIDKPLVLDADGLAPFGGAISEIAHRRQPTILTPHSGELARLVAATAEEIDAGRIHAAREASRTSRAVVLLKGSPTVVADPDGRTVLTDTGGPLLSTAGTGDVLTGIIAALAAHLTAFDAAWVGAWIHGRAADLLAPSYGDRGMMAGDIVDAIPLAIAEARL